jgi:hypothetical protein
LDHKSGSILTRPRSVSIGANSAPVLSASETKEESPEINDSSRNVTKKHDENNSSSITKESQQLPEHSFLAMGASNSPKYYSDGIEMANQKDLREMYEEKIRSYAEECDQLQGFFSFVDVQSGFSGVATQIMEHINEYYNGCPILSIGLKNPQGFREYESHKDPISTINEAMLSIQMPHLASLHIPLECLKGSRFDDLVWDHENELHTSATLASLIDSLTLPTRTNRGCNENPIFGVPILQTSNISNFCRATLGDCNALNFAYVTAVANASVLKLKRSVQFGSTVKFIRDIDYLDTDIVSESVIWRGIQPLKPELQSGDLSYTKYAERMLIDMMNVDTKKSLKNYYIIPTPISLPASFPPVLCNQDHPELSMLLWLSSSKSCKTILSNQYKLLRELKMSGLSLFETWGRGIEDMHQAEQLFGELDL